MTGDRVGEIVGILGAMILVGSAVIARHRRHGLGFGNAMRSALVWLAVFAALFAAAHWMDGRA